MKLQLTEYDYTHNKYLTYLENTTGEILGSVGLYPNAIVKSDETLITGSLKDITKLEGRVTGDDTYIEIPQNESIQLSFKNADSIIGQIGKFSDSSPVTTAFINIIHQGESATSKYQLKYQHPDTTYYLSPADKTPNTTKVRLSAELDGFGSGSDFALMMEGIITITNNSAAAEYIRIYDIDLSIYNTVKSGVQTKRIMENNGQAVTYVPSKPGQKGYYIAAQTYTVLSITKKDVAWDGDNIFASATGRMYDKWIDSVNGSARSNGRNEGDVIHQPAGIVESILRDEVFTERDLIVTTKTARNTLTVDDLRSSADDYYNYAYLYNVTQNFQEVITDYEGSTKTITVSGVADEIDANDLIYITNIQGDNKINYASFDLLNNTTNGTRKDWRFIRTLHQEEYPSSILEKLLYEMRAILFTSHNQYKIVALDEASSADTWTEPLKQGGRYLFSSSLTPLEQLFNDYKIHYDYDYGSGDYRKTLFVNKNGFSEELTSGATYQTTCKSIFDAYKRINKFEYNCDWIKGIDYAVGGGYVHHTVAEYFFDKIFAWHSKQRMIVNWAAPVSDYLQYEVGDQVILNNTKLIPTGINNSSKFMIFENPIIPLPGAPIINFKLIEMTDA